MNSKEMIEYMGRYPVSSALVEKTTQEYIQMIMTLADLAVSLHDMKPEERFKYMCTAVSSMLAAQLTAHELMNPGETTLRAYCHEVIDETFKDLDTQELYDEYIGKQKANAAT